MKTIKTLLFAATLLAMVPSCKKCYTCTLPAHYNCIASGQTVKTEPDLSTNSYYDCTTNYAGSLSTIPTGGSSTKHCYNTSGPLGGALNGQATALDNDESNCQSNGGTWTAN